MAKKKNFHVVPHNNGWAVKRAGGAKASSVHPTQKAAIGQARGQASGAKGEVVFHGRDGQIRDKDSYGNDPCPPKDRKH